MNNAAAPGWYHAQGDPDATVRYWDGGAWTTEPMPPPPGWSGGPDDGIEYGSTGRRIAAALIDGTIAGLVVAPFMFGYMRDVFNDLDAGGDGSDVAVPTELYIPGIILSIVFLLMIAYRGGTPGKLMLSLRITTADGVTTPPGFLRALRRTLPALFAWVPGIGQVVATLLPIVAFVMVLSDDERRSLHDRIADTRVIRIRS